jgi:parallel beta-helix repeat protein
MRKNLLKKGGFRTMKTFFRILSILMILGFVWSSPAFSEVVVYDASGKLTGTYTTIQVGIDACPVGGKVSVNAGTYNEAVKINKKIALIGAGATQTTISAQGLDNKNTVDFDGTDTAGATISGFKITGAKGYGFVGKEIGINYGNGILCNNGAKPTIINNTIAGNSQVGIISYSSSPTISNNTISGNIKDGIVCVHSSPSIINNTISKNGKAGVMLDFSSSPTIYNNTLSWNNEDGIYCTNDSSPSIYNNIITKNGATSTDYCGIFNDPDDPSNPIINYNCVWGNGVSGENNYNNCSSGTNAISADPQFVAPDDFHLKAISPCIDRGTNTPPNRIPTTDKDDNPRIIGIIDMGAYELQKTPTLKSAPKIK